MGHIREIRDRLKLAGIAQQRPAQMLDIDRSDVSRILSGLRRPSADFVERAISALDALETAEMAAEEARERGMPRAATKKESRTDRLSSPVPTPVSVPTACPPG